MSEDSSQWLFPVDALYHTPSSSEPLEKILYDLSRGVEFLFRLGTSLKLPSPALFTAATWFHRFYMRYSLQDFHRQDVAAACVFLATKTEECGRKLRDVAKVYHSKLTGVDPSGAASECKEVDQYQTAILMTEEYLLQAICFDFTVESPHAELVDLFGANPNERDVQDYAWTFAHDSYRTPLCILYPPRIIATACFILAQYIAEGPNSLPLDARISFSAPSSSLPTPPSHKPASPDASRLAIEFFGLSANEVQDVTDAVALLLEYYSVQDLVAYPHLAHIAAVQLPKASTPRDPMYKPFGQLQVAHAGTDATASDQRTQTPRSSHGDIASPFRPSLNTN
ncbi:cyclin-like protein [Gymnopus androsaceus JB14]|uniref:Cyclin-like protein n=1 Tax=Gymnopus androsaceus JB14 TaxID=1447944 RepID=A0A6A4GQK9_9AGAR|nr:cyclin-like protein [Gymnopus androsaceus JB14]